MHYVPYNCVIIGSGSLLSVWGKPLPEPMMSFHELESLEQTLMTFE